MARLQIAFLRGLADAEMGDFELRTLERNRFAYLGNGFTAREFDGRDLTWYLGSLNGLDKQPQFEDKDVAGFAAAAQV